MRALPQILPVGLYEAAARRGITRQGTGSHPTSDGQGAAAIPRQFSGAGYPSQVRSQATGHQSPVPTGDQWAISSQDKAQFDSIYATVDPQNRGFITGDQAVAFFSNARLPEEVLAQIWDLADINSEGQLNRDEFAVAMYLIRQQRAKRDGRDALPQSLPPNLIPPSMRRQPIAPQQPTAPTFDNAANITKPKSAADDLFGLDALSTPSAKQPKSSLDANEFIPSSPTRSQTSPPAQAPLQPSSHFKPFMPTSSFGQTIMTPQDTGTSSSTSPSQIRTAQTLQGSKPSAMDDLLGDNDPEVSKNLTNETTEFANLSNQVTTLTNQMSEVKKGRGMVEQNLNQAQAQKRDFENRLAQLRLAYQQEVKDVQNLEDQLRISKAETQKLQSDTALISATYEDLQNQHRQATEALSADQAENARLKEKISQTSTEINELKPRLEKAKMDARQQKGLVAIYKKQLAGNEIERESIRGDIDSTLKEHEEATRELEESKKAAETLSQATRSPPPAVASRSPSSGSLNPFLRQSSNVANDRGVSSPFTSSALASSNNNAFESFFGPSISAPSTAPPTSFKTQTIPPVTETPGPVGQTITPQLSEVSELHTPPVSPPPSNFSDSPQAAGEPPAPPQSRQITSSFLPLRPNLDQSSSETSSIRVIPPASRMGESSASGAMTPTQLSNDDALSESPKQHFEEIKVRSSAIVEPSAGHPSQEMVDANTEHQSTQEASDQQDSRHSLGDQSSSQGVPGAFPGDDLPEKDDYKAPFNSSPSPYSGSGLDPRTESTSQPNVDGKNQPLGTETIPRVHTPNSAKADFDSAFAGFDDKGKAPDADAEKVVEDLPTTSTAKGEGEFPPIREFGGDEDSESDEEKGFEDDFMQQPSSGQKSAISNDARDVLSESGGLHPRPPFHSVDSNHSQLPTPGAQSSPPTYDQTVKIPPTGTEKRRDSNQFPAEYTGLLPSRENPTSPPLFQPDSTTQRSIIPPGAETNSQPEALGTASNIFHPISSASPFAQNRSPMSPGASTAAPYAYTQSPPLAQPNPPVPPKTTLPKDDFEDEFGDLSEAKEASDKGEDDVTFSHNRNNDLDDFNPTFDSPAPSRFTEPGSQSSTFPQAESFANFQAGPAAGTTRAAPYGNVVSTETTSDDWDAIFAGLDTPQNNGVGSDLDFTPAKPQTANQLLQHNGTIAEGRKPPSQLPVANDDIGDDPILKRLTGMGYPRDESLKALEKYDYNLDKVR